MSSTRIELPILTHFGKFGHHTINVLEKFSYQRNARKPFQIDIEIDSFKFTSYYISF